MIDPNPIGQLIATLADVPAVVAAVPGGFFHDAAPSGTVAPYGIVEFADPSTADPEFGGDTVYWTAALFLRVVVEGASRVSGRAARALVLSALESAPWADPAFAVADLFVQSLPEDVEIDDGQTRRFQFLGAIVSLSLVRVQ